MHINSYNILDKIIASFRSKELKKNFSLKDKIILDFGCGSNFSQIKKVYNQCKEVTLVDRITDNFKDGKYNFINYDNDLNILKNNIANSHYDIIILSAVIEHLDYPEHILNILKTKLNDTGVIFLTAPGKKSQPLLEFMAYKLGIINADLIREHKRYYDKNEYILLSQKTNMNIKKFYHFELGMNTACILK